MTGVVVTGVGCIGPWGIGFDALCDALARGEPLAREVDRSAGLHRQKSARTAGVLPDLDLGEWVAPAKARRMSAMSQYAVAAARMARVAARLEHVDGSRFAVSLANAFGPMGFTEQLMCQIRDKGGRAASPFLFTDCVANAAAAQVAIDHPALAANLTVSQREAGPLAAVALGVEEIARGRADVCLAGSVEEVLPFVHAVLDRLRTLARPVGGVELPRPFDRDRNGVLTAAGATVLVLESSDHAAARDAEILARVGATARAFDPTASRAGFGERGAAVADRLRAACDPSRVGAVVSGASGSRAGDRVETEMLRRAFSNLPPIVAPKAVHGEFGGGTLAAGLAALHGRRFGRPVGFETVDPELGIELAPYEGVVDSVLLTAVASGGAAAWVRLDVG